MSSRERTLAMLVGGLGVIFASVIVFDKASARYKQLNTQLASKTADLARKQGLLGEREIWVQRNAALNSKQPALTNPTSAGVPLIEEAKAVADKNNVLIKDQAIGGVDTKPTAYQSVTVTFKTSSTAKDIVNFLSELQAPDRFLVLEKAAIKIDESDPTKMAGTFTLAKWFAPAGAH